MKSAKLMCITAMALSTLLVIPVRPAAQDTGVDNRVPSHITTFNVKGAGQGAYQGTVAGQINRRGLISGYYIDSSGVNHCFLRAPHGKITTFSVKNATGSVSNGLNLKGSIAGYYADSNSVFHGFLRAPDGIITMFDEPDAGTGSYQGTFAFDINDL